MIRIASLRLSYAASLRLGLGLSSGFLPLQTALADTTWDGSEGQVWTDPLNWSNGVPLDASNNGSSFINIATGNTPIYSTGTSVTDWDVFIGNGSGASGKLVQTGGTLAVGNGNWMMIGSNGGTGTFELSGSSSLTAGRVNIGGGQFQGSGTATVNMSGGAMTALGGSNGGQTFGLSVGYAGTGILNLSGGTIHSQSETWVGASGSGTINQSAGIVNTNSWLAIGRNSGGIGVYNLSGGTVNAATTGGFATLGSFAGATGTLDVSGTGTFNVAGNRQLIVGEGGTGTLNVSGTGLVNVTHATEGVRLGAGTGSTGTVNLDGGTIETTMVTKGTGAGTFNFNGGTLKAMVATGTFMQGMTNAFVKAGGAVINSNGVDVTIAQNLLAHSTSTGGGFTKNGAGTLTLTGANTFTGAVVINDGTLYANSGNAATNRTFSFASDITINNGATLRAGSNSLFGWDGTQEKTITVNAGGTLTANGGATSDVGVGTVILNGGTLATIAGGAGDWGSWRFDQATDKLQVTEDSTISAQNVKFGNASAQLEVAAGKTASFTGTITNATAGGISYLTKTGAGTLTLSGTNTYTGTTSITTGVLKLGATGSIDNSSGVLLGSGGTFDVTDKTGGYSVASLGGSGDVLGTLTISSQLAMGNSPGTVDFSNLIIGATATDVHELTGGGITADLGNVSGTLTITDGAVLDLVQLGTYSLGDKFTLFAYNSGSLTGLFRDSGNTLLGDGSIFADADGLWAIDYDDLSAGLNGGTGDRFITVTAVPEPAAAAMGGLGLLALLRRRRQR